MRLEVDLTHPSYATYVMTAEIHGTTYEPCRRCLKPVAVEVSDRFRVVYREGDEGHLEDEDLVPIEPGADRIDIGREVRDRLFLETEWYPLCREDCRGLCPLCGRNRNETGCECVESEPDSRWEALEQLRESG